MKFAGEYHPRSSVGRQPGGPPGETEVLRLNPDRHTRILDATGWKTLEPGSLNLAVRVRDFDDLLAVRPTMTEPGTDIRYPHPFEPIPIARVEYYYYRATASHAGKSRPVLARRPKIPSPQAKVVELFAEVNLVTELGLKPGDLVNIELPE
jgi:hypothetical protein